MATERYNDGVVDVPLDNIVSPIKFSTIIATLILKIKRRLERRKRDTTTLDSSIIT